MSILNESVMTHDENFSDSHFSLTSLSHKYDLLPVSCLTYTFQVLLVPW